MFEVESVGPPPPNSPLRSKHGPLTPRPQAPTTPEPKIDLPAGWKPPASDGAKEQKSGVVRAPDPKTAKNNVLNIFKNRSQKASIQHLSNADLTIEPRTLSGGMLIEQCSKCKITIPSKVASLILLDCTDVQLHFFGTVSMAEFVRCSGLEIRCTGSCSTYNIDHTSDCSLSIPAASSEVHIISSATKDVIVNAVDEKSETTSSHSIVEPSEFDPNRQQWRTRYKQGEPFESSLLDREGPLGYFSSK